MAWLVVSVSLVVIWVASLCKVFFGATSSSRATILDDGKTPQKKNVMFIIAHPDDESMFFSPTINYLTSNVDNLHILCLSTGNADGMGNTRKDELHQACAVLKVPLQQLKVLDHPNLQDGFGQVWNHDLLTEIIEEEVTKHDIHTIITFDNYGVSGHCNHRDVHRGVLTFLQTNSGRHIKAWELVSLNIFRKYCGPVDIWLSILSARKHPSNVIIINEQPWKSFKAMAQHLSQWVWFRKLFVSFSSYTYTNTLNRIIP
ncbi:PREDICTED: probable N-acetylglucosaminyl-phosphatidylinositol de-N-acetylase [Camelina sativa]|uniref:N-acetylglucosaminylphosphatidylinositol deacetylase n=1 Tax=Camelina sativa TaxID=90675 RepID=A0ABM0ZJ46_CAMSA|nr:PREDICTED: probable N-acetylglucosaminyl-phosphatidylinositol de-N-acetylase [Camelina sativa]